MSNEPDGPTPFIEANAILAAQERDTVQVMIHLNKLSAHERRSLYHAAEFLLDILDQEHSERS